MTLIRVLVNIVLAMIVSAAIVVLLLAGYGVVMSSTWENEGLDYGATVEEGEPQNEWLWVEGEPISYRVWGSGAQGSAPASWVVLVHGLQAEGSETWAPVARLLARRGAQVLTVDLRGMGRTVRDGDLSLFTAPGQANLLAVVLNELQIRDATVVGQGWGSAVALQMAYEQPLFVDQLVLVAPVLDRPWQPWQARIAAVPYLGKAAVWLTHTGGPLWAIEQRRVFSDPGVASSDYMRRIQRATRVVGTAAAWQAIIASPPDSDLPEALASIPISTLVLVGERDGRLSPDKVQDLLKALPAAQLKSLSDAGHYVHIEQATVVARYIDSVRR